MFYYVSGDPLNGVLSIENLEKLITERFQLYFNQNLQCDTEEFNYYDRVTHLCMAIIAIDFPHFRDLFASGELRIFREKLKCMTELEIKKELSGVLKYLDNLSQSEECRILSMKQLNQLQLVRNVVEIMLSKCGHAFRRGHLKRCRKLKLTLPFTFLLRLVAKRQVEVANGKVSLSCGRWDEILEVVFEILLQVELTLAENCSGLREKVYEAEDDRLRQIIRRFSRLLKGDLRGFDIKAVDIDEESQYFPPCMANLHQILRRTHRLSYDSRYQYTLFLKDIGLSVDENILFWEKEYSKPAMGSTCTHEWEEKQKRYKYQIQHLYGLIGTHGFKTSHPCDKFIEDLQTKMDGGCPFQHFTESHLRSCFPEGILSCPDVEDIFKYKSAGLPRKACEAYLRCQGKVRSRKDAMVGKMFCVVSPLHYYSAAKEMIGFDGKW